MIWAIILAAGESKRMGMPKMLLPFGGKTMIEMVIDHALRSNADKVVVVLGAKRHEIERIVKPFPVKMVHNAEYKRGMLSSVQAGFKALPEETEAALILLGDQPSIPSVILDEVIEVYKKTGKSLVVPVYGRKRGHPLLIDMRYRQEVQSLNPDIGLRELLHRHVLDVHEIQIEDSSILRDLDDMKDYQKELKYKH